MKTRLLFILLSLTISVTYTLQAKDDPYVYVTKPQNLTEGKNKVKQIILNNHLKVLQQDKILNGEEYYSVEIRCIDPDGNNHDIYFDYSSKLGVSKLIHLEFNVTENK
ncbi:hypothetical protein [Flammeovirga sp. SubArs3]|uniref:hypothetical protein n=1 Tax=Flammeovirga sp. SubArs3 TaxID=2995316 RepID=UPI00248C6118|nr:hypothetical protein [Flammeovirga sp. SubArs3]